MLQEITTSSLQSASSFSLCKTNSVVSKIKFCVIWSNEYITKDPQRSTWRWDINSHETTQADCLAELRDLETNNFARFSIPLSILLLIQEAKTVLYILLLDFRYSISKIQLLGYFV